MRRPFYCIKNAVDLFLLANPGAKLRVVLHTSCVLDDPASLEGLLREPRVTPCLTRDSYHELCLLARYSKLPPVRKAAGLLTRGDRAEVYPLDLMRFTQESVLRRCFHPAGQTPVFFVFYTPAEAEEFAFGLCPDEDGGSALSHACLLCFDARLSDAPSGSGWMFAQPVPLLRFLTMRGALKNEREPSVQDPRVFRRLLAQDGEVDRSVDKDAFVAQVTEGDRVFRFAPFDDPERFQAEFHDCGRIRGSDLIDPGLHGGEAAILLWRSTENKTYSIKMYYKPPKGRAAADRIKKLSFLAAYAPCFSGRAAFPKAAVYDVTDPSQAPAFCGFLMEYFPGGKNDVRNADTLSYALTDVLEDVPPGKADKVWQILTPLTTMILEMRLLQINPVDLSLQNILVTRAPGQDGRFLPHLIDCDSYETSLYTTAIDNPSIRHPGVAESLRKRTWFRERRFSDFSFSVVLANCVSHMTYLLGAVGGNDWTTKDAFDPTTVEALPERQRRPIVDQLTFKKEYPIGAWIEFFMEEFFSVAP